MDEQRKIEEERNARKKLLESKLDELNRTRELVQGQIISVREELRRIENDEEDDFIVAGIDFIAARIKEGDRTVFTNEEEFCHDCGSYGHLKSCGK